MGNKTTSTCPALSQEDARLAGIIRRSAEIFFAVPYEQIMNRSRLLEIVFIRGCCFRIYSENTRSIVSFYGEAFGGLYHRTTIIRCIGVLRRQMETDPRYADIFNNFSMFVRDNIENAEKGMDMIPPAWNDRAERLRHIRKAAGLSVIKSILVEDCGESCEIELV